ncbi:serine/threonine-protein kinase par-1-like [Gouania willdenowi]|uniref:serine/threonine-protein kinase par-1-like n=1 Tax=Gouania willdenowi TaxID=441366 RepID=UPI001056180C|nr:serine/threonine-protein kinase par-1-like [Gouania willdenowi]
MFGCVRNVFKKCINRKNSNNNNPSFLRRAFLSTKRNLRKFVQKFKKDKSKAAKRTCIPQQIPHQKDDEHHEEEIFSQDIISFPDLSSISSDSEFGWSRTITNQKTCTWATIPSFPSSSTGSNPTLSSAYVNDSVLEALEYSCHHPDAMKTTFHRNSVVLSSSKEFTSKYKEEELLGEGGYSQVYAGECRSTSTPVAIKHIPKKDVRFARVNCQGNVYHEILEVFLMEQAAGRLCDGSFENPAVIGLVDTFELETEVIIVMERPPDTVDGHDYMFKVKHVPEDQVKIIFKQIINAALLMHKNGVFHRDLKLENLLVDRNKGTPEIRVIDFGCGDFVENEPFREFNGTPDFAPPEVYCKETYRAEATTVWQIGVMLYMICTRDSFETLKYIEQDNKVLGNVSKKCNDFLSRCLAFYPSQRPTLEDLLLHPWLELTGPHSNDPVLEVQEYSCHQPEAMKTTFHRNSVVLSSRKEFTSRYKEEELLGEGGFSQVYAGECRSTSTPVAIKHIQKEDVQFVKVNCQGNVYKEILEVFLMEQAAGRLCDGSFKNPAVIGLMDTFELETEVIIVMERLPDTVDMFDYLLEVRVPEDQAKIIIKQIINAALLMHKNGVFHRDLKLNNILVKRNKGTPEIRVIDFGCGDFVENEPFGKFDGAPAFAPPEHICGETYMAEATTVWQIGVMLYMIITNAGFDTSMFMIEMIEGDLVLNYVSNECNDFLNQCLALDPNQRPTIEDLLLHPWLE